MVKTKEELQKLTKPALLEYSKEIGLEEDLTQLSKSEIIEKLFEFSKESIVEGPDDTTTETESEDTEPLEETVAVNEEVEKSPTSVAMDLELAKRKSRYSTGIAHEGKSSEGAFKAELARRQSRYGKSVGDVENIDSAFSQELARRATLKN